MNNNLSTCLVILAGGRSTRMGTDKAVIEFGGHRMVDILIDRFAGKTDLIFLSAAKDYGTGLDIICDDPGFPDGPVGAILSISAMLQQQQSPASGFVTVPVDAPFAPADLIERLSASGACAVARDHQRIHPTFAYWRCDVADKFRSAHVPGERAPSLRWLAQQCYAESITWPDQRMFMNINRPEDLIIAEDVKKAGT